jgi:ribosomal protein S6--L-glutamate ligase/gamma-F420-2:alpha-L-glutamate ligase
MRIYALGGKVVGCVLRSSDTSFKSNFSLGGKVKKTTATARQKEIVKTLYEKLNFDFVGIDFIKDGNRWVFNEMEDPVGARMLYAVSKTDIAKKLIDYIVERL